MSNRAGPQFGTRLGGEADFSYFRWYKAGHGPIAQLDRVTDFYSVGCRFESCWDRHFQAEKPGKSNGLRCRAISLVHASTRPYAGRCGPLTADAGPKLPDKLPNWFCTADPAVAP